MNQIQWLHSLANKKYLNKNQFNTLVNNKYVEDYSYFSDDVNCEIYLIRISDDGWDKGFYDKRFLVSLIKDDFTCKCGGYYEYIENQIDCEYTMLLTCTKCEDVVERYRD